MKIKNRKLILFLCTISLIAPIAAFAKAKPGTEKFIDRALRNIYDGLDEVEDEVAQADSRIKKFSKSANLDDSMEAATNLNKVLVKTQKSITGAITDVQELNDEMDWSGEISQPASCSKVESWKKDFSKGLRKNLFFISNNYMNSVDEIISKFVAAGIDVSEAQAISEETRTAISGGHELLVRMQESYTSLLDKLGHDCM